MQPFKVYQFRDLDTYIYDSSTPKPFSSPTTAFPELMSEMQCTQTNENKFSFQFNYVYVCTSRFVFYFFILYYMELVLYYPDVMLNVKWSCFFLNKFFVYTRIICSFISLWMHLTFMWFDNQKLNFIKNNKIHKKKEIVTICIQ